VFMLCIGSFLGRLISLDSAVFVHRHKLSRTKLFVGPDVVSHEAQTQAPPGNWGADAGAMHVRTCVNCASHFTLDFLKHFISKSQTNLTTLGKCPKTQWTPLAHGI